MNFIRVLFFYRFNSMLFTEDRESTNVSYLFYLFLHTITRTFLLGQVFSEMIGTCSFYIYTVRFTTMICFKALLKEAHYNLKYYFEIPGRR